MNMKLMINCAFVYMYTINFVIIKYLFDINLSFSLIFQNHFIFAEEWKTLSQSTSSMEKYILQHKISLTLL
jgi:hypothetical protein